MSDSVIRMVVGLGNPGKAYEATRHNVGFLALDSLLATLTGEPALTQTKQGGSVLSSLIPRGKSPYMKVRCEALTYEIEYDGKRLVLAKPQTFMNHSGQSIKGLMKHYHLGIDEFLVIHDDLDLPVGILRIKAGGGAGGHNGIRSIIESCGADFARLKVGIGRPPGQMPAERYVLQEMKGDFLDELKLDAARAALAASTVLQSGVLAAQNLVNG
ncbi:MAG: aminoacyl-tRNA hydrolase [Coriobacteriia bacterium]|nr:aminoacyl-tRNA hydrolase [Coriobacteriia bacterium]